MKRRDSVPSRLSPKEESEVMTVSEVASYLKCHPSTVYRFLTRRALPAFRLGGGWRFLRSEVDKWINEQHARPRAPQKPKDSGRKRGGKRKR